MSAGAAGDMGPNELPELAISLAWHRGQLGSAFRATDGRSVEIVHRGVWTHGFGPDFAEAMVLFDGRDFRSGAIEVHRFGGGWFDHGHHLDPRYDDVVLHVALRDDGSPARTSSGALVPLVVIDPAAVPPLPNNGVDPGVWTRFGGSACAPDLARERPAVLRDALWGLGDRRLAAKSARIAAGLTAASPGETLWAELLDGLGFSANRDPMRRLAIAVPLAALDALVATRQGVAGRLAVSRAVLFGAAGFLPLSPTDAGLAELAPAEVQALESEWDGIGGPWVGSMLPPTAWTRARVRPANHPAARIAAAAAAAVASAERGGLVASLLEPLRAEVDPVAALIELAAEASPGIGVERAADIVASSLLPFAFALSDASGDGDLADAASRCWSALPAGSPNATSRRALRQAAGPASLGPLGARGAQGLLYLDGQLCAPRRCFECPIAHRVIAASLGAGGHATADR